MTSTGLVFIVSLLSTPPGPQREALERQLAELAPKVATDARAACNAGWLRFQLGDLLGAAKDLNSGIERLEAAPDQARVLGACLYNRGRVHEAEGGVEAARAAYTRSLSLRPNSTVEKRLGGLPPPPPPRPWNTRQGAWSAPPAELLPLLRQAPRPEGLSGSPVFLVGLHASGSAPSLSEAWLVWLGDDLRPKGAEFLGELRVAARVNGTLRLSEPVATLQEGAACYEEADATLQLVSDAVGPLALARVKLDHIDYEGGHNASVTQTLTALWPDGDELAVRTVTLGESSSFEPREGEGDEGGEMSEYLLEATLTNDGKLRLGRKRGQLTPELKSLLGVSVLRQRDPPPGR